MANADTTSAADTIAFNIPGGGVHTITPLSFLFIEYSLTIDGTTQPGYAGVPLIEINAVNNTYGLEFNNTGLNESRTYIVRSLIINRASDDGIHMESNGTFEFLAATITGCYIGTNSSGTADLGNGGDGIEISASNGGTVIGGTALGQRNVISGNGGDGIKSRVTDTMEIYNNYIGTNAAGTGDLGNTGNGIHSIVGTVIIGGTSGSGVNRGNVISGNNANGIFLEGLSATVQRNLVGTNAAGTGDLGNSQNGILIDDDSDNLIGSSTSSLDGNTISGNGGDVNNGNGIKLLGGSDGNQIFGNRIGTNSAGTAVLQNDSDGIEIINSKENQIGLAGSSAARNTIAGNNFHGIVLSGSSSIGNLIQNNFIGTNSSGTNLGNGGDGIIITSALIITDGLNVIGGSAANAGNTIAFNDNAHGVNIATISSRNRVQNNTIHSNLGSGVTVSSSGSTGNTIRQNTLYSNQAGLGINLGGSGVALNDLNDADTGANDLQNFPVLQNANPTRIVGTLNSLANQTFTLDFYRVDSCDSSGNGEGRYYLASTNVTTVGNNAAFNFAFAGLTIGQIVTATATDLSGNTSEFSQCLTVTPETGDFRFLPSNYNVNESVASATITVNRTGGTGGTITVDYATTDNTAIAGADYTATSGTLTFLDGETSKIFSVPINNDATDEPDESFDIALSNPTGGALLVNPSTGTVTITDNDNPPTVSITDVSQVEGNSGTTNFVFTVNLSAASGFDVSVDYATANNTATAGIDYTATSGTINFSSALAETSKTVVVTVNGDLVVELNETFFVNLSNPVNATLADAQGIGTITDDDNPGNLQFEQSVYSGAEGTQVFVIVTRTNGTAGTISINYATGGGDATPNVDYTPASGTLIFGDGEISKDFRVDILPDSESELLETFNIVLSNPIGGATLGSPSTATVYIASPTAAAVSVGGRVSAANGRGVANAFVTMTDQSGATRTTTTNPFGYFRFNNVQSGATYVFTVSHKRHQFAVRVLTVSEDISELDFTAEN